MDTKKVRIKKGRNCSGSLSGLMLCVVVWITFLVGALAVDLCRIQLVTEQLQNAADAGALAGAQDLWKNIGNAEKDARIVCARNNADGRSVSSSTPGTDVAVKVTPPAGSNMGEVEVKASMAVTNLFSPLFGRTEDRIHVFAVAGTVGNLTQIYANQAFPLAVSIDAKPNGKFVTTGALKDYKIGDEVVFYINSQQVKNAAFTSLSETQTASAKYIKDAISQGLGLEPAVPGFIPSVSVGDQINLNNGIVGQRELSNSPHIQALTDPNRPPLTLPVISGDPAFNKSREVIGFISFKPTWVTFGQGGGVVETISGKLMRVQVRGMSGDLEAAGGGFGNSALAESIVGPIQLIR